MMARVWKTPWQKGLLVLAGGLLILAGAWAASGLLGPRAEAMTQLESRPVFPPLPIVVEVEGVLTRTTFEDGYTCFSLVETTMGVETRYVAMQCFPP